jgi:DNA-directed RNA polymerase specialized sigma24 family protein
VKEISPLAEDTMSQFAFDLDHSLDSEISDFTSLSPEVLEEKISQLPGLQAEVARAVLVDQRTMSDVSQAFAMRQSELVSLLNRAMLTLGKTSK